MTAGLVRYVGLIAVAALAVFVTWQVPVGTQEEPVALPDDLGEKSSITLGPGETLQRTLRLSEKPVKGLVVFSPSVQRIDGQLAVRVLLGGEVVAKSSSWRQAWRKNSWHLIFSLPEINVPDRTDVNVEITRLSGKPVPIKVSQSGMMTMSLLHPALLDLGVRQGVLIGVVLLLGVGLIGILPKRRWLAAGLLLVVVVPLGLAGFIWPVGELGISDWDYYLAVHESYRRILFEHSSWPTWNPYTCGGTAGLADPEFPIYSPLYLLEILFGVSLGLRLAVVVAVTVGALGMLTLGKRLGFTVQSALLASIIFAFSSTTLLKLVEGHVDMLAAMWIPWIFWSWLVAYNRRGRWPLLVGIFLALTFLQGGLHILLYLVPALIILSLLVIDKKRALLVTWWAGWWALGLSAIKLWPVLLWVRQFPDTAYAVSASTLPWLHEILLGRNLHGANVIPDQGGGWHEYGAYVGAVVLALAILGITRWRSSRLVRVLLLGIMGTLLLSSLGPVLKPALDLMPWVPRSYTSRVIVLTVFGLALLAGVGLEIVSAWLKGSKWRMLTGLIVGVVAIDLISLAYPIAAQAFVLPGLERGMLPAPAPIAFTRETHKVRVGSNDYDRAAAVARQGYGTLAYCSVLGPKPAVSLVTDDDNNYITLVNGAGEVELISWLPNVVVVQTKVEEATQVKINTNFAKGWLANEVEAQNVEGLVGAQVSPGETRTVFRYRAPGAAAGRMVTIVTVLLAIFYGSRRSRGR